MIKNTTKIQKLCWVVFMIYIVGLFYFTFFAEALGRGDPGTYAAVKRFNLIPFTEIRRFWVYRQELGMKAFLLNVVGNILAFMPCGFLLPAISRRCRRGWGVMAIGFLISFFIECTQLIFQVGSFDVDDMLLNTLGAVLGFYANRAVQFIRFGRRLKKSGSRVRIRELGDKR